MDYKEAIKMLGDRDNRKVGNHTYLRRTGPAEIRLRLHDTDVLVFQPRRCILNSGGWRTVTTKERINFFGPARVVSVRGVWTVGRAYGPQVQGVDGRWKTPVVTPGVPFKDGMAVNYRGQPIKSFKPEGDITTAFERTLAIRPYVVKAADIVNWKARLAAGQAPRFPFKQLPTGQSWQSHGFTLEIPEVRGWEFVKEHFCDSSGFGRPGEAALTPDQFLELIVPGHAYAISGVGQFQVKVAEFKRPGNESGQRAAVRDAVIALQ